jgi:EPS-associated MarR family transcriptional regulator
LTKALVVGSVQPLNAQPSFSESGEATDDERAHFALMRLLEVHPELSQRQAATSLGMSLGKVNYVLRALMMKGFVKVQNYRNSTNKLAYFYLLTPSGIAAKTDLTRRFLAYKLREYEQLRAEIEELKKESSNGA